MNTNQHELYGHRQHLELQAPSTVGETNRSLEKGTPSLF